MNKIANVPLRLPLELRDFLLNDAKLNRRSMNSHMLAILEERQRSLSLNEKSPACNEHAEPLMQIHHS